MASAGRLAKMELRILMLHGYTQSGESFHAKTRVLEKRLEKQFKGVQLSYPTAPIRLHPADIPGYVPATPSSETAAWGWWRKPDSTHPPEYVGMEKAFETVAEVLEREGPFDGVIGFSQGAALAAITASLLEGDSRREAFKKAQQKSAFAIPYPPAFAKLKHPPLKFCIEFCGFCAPPERYSAFYEEPHIQTPVCHVLGSLDSVVVEHRSLKLVEACGGPDKTQVVIHPGGHFVPTSKQYLDIVAAFIQQHTTATAKKPEEAVEERLEDMDVPF